MKVRDGFVSNSSSSSFIILKELLSKEQIDEIFNNIDDYFYSWIIESYDDFIFGRTDMDNFDMQDFFENELNIEPSYIKWDIGYISSPSTSQLEFIKKMKKYSRDIKLKKINKNLMNDKIKDIINKSINVKSSIYSDDKLIEKILDITFNIIKAYNNGGKVLFCGNGGSAADAQHLAAELSGRFYFDREPLYSEALHVNSSYVTAVANDYGYDEIYARLVKAMCKKEDILIGLSTSGNSLNIINAFKEAKKLGIMTIAFTGETGGDIKELSDILINVPSSDTPRIQESHIMIGHIICELVEENIFK